MRLPTRFAAFSPSTQKAASRVTDFGPASIYAAESLSLCAEEIQDDVTRIETKLNALKAIPYGKKALSAAKDIVRAAVKENLWGLYRGEMLCDLAEWGFAVELDPELADKYYLRPGGYRQSSRE